jgi:putative transposase
MNLSHKIQLRNLTEEQIIALSKACGCARFTYNWALAEWTRQYKENGKKVSIYDLAKKFNIIKKEQFPWIYDSPKWASQRSFIDLKDAITRFFRKESGYPKFKKKYSHNCFYINANHIKILDTKIRLAKLGWFDLTERLRIEGTTKFVHVSRDADKWFVSVTLSTNCQKERLSNNVIGIDVGLKNNVVTSDNNVVTFPEYFKSNSKKISKLTRQYERKQKDSNNKIKSLTKLSRKYYKISCKRRDFIHKLTTKLCSENQAIGVETVPVQAWRMNNRWGRKINDLSFGRFYKQLKYKGLLYNCNVFFAGKKYPSTQICSMCGVKKEKEEKLTLKDRVFICKNCGLIIDRDLNAARNLKKICTEGLSGINACGHDKVHDSVRNQVVVDEARSYSTGYGR